MKKCLWCGSEYPDTTERCAIDAQPLSGGEAILPESAPLVDLLAVNPPATTAVAVPTPALKPTERQLRIFEVVLLCVIALGGYILFALGHFPGMTPSNAAGSNRSWSYSFLHETSALALLWYILLRRSRSITDLGFSWTNKDVPRSALVWLLGTLGFCAVYGIFYLSGLTAATHPASTARVERLLFGGGITFMTLVFQFLNPFFEELIVRAYLMTEVRQLTNSVAKAVLLSTLIQMSYHFYQGAVMAIAEGGTFLVFSLYYARTNRITPVILAHLYMDVLATLAFMLHH